MPDQNQQQPNQAQPQQDVSLDLDAMMPVGRRVRYNGQIITVGQPTTEQFLQLAACARKLENQTAENYNPDDLGETLKAIIAICGTLAPELEDAKLEIPQALALIKLVAGMTQTDQMQELAKRGITPSEAPKGAAS